MKKIYFKLFKSHWTGLFILFFLVSFLVNFFNDEFVQTDELYYQHIEKEYSDKYGGYEEFEDDLEDLTFLEEEDNLSVEDVLFDILYIMIQAVITIPILAMLLSSGYFLYDKYSKIKYRVVFKSVLLSSFIFLLELLIKVFYFSFFQSSYSFNDVLKFKPFHLTSLFNKDSLANWLVPFLDLINLFDIGFLISVSYLIAYLYRKNFARLLLYTGVIYLIINILWEIFILYLVKIL